MDTFPKRITTMNRLNCPHCKFTSKYEASFINDAIHDHKEISCVACGGRFKIIIECQPSAAELLRAPTEAGGESCMCEKPLDDDGWRCIGCGKLLAPRLGG